MNIFKKIFHTDNSIENIRVGLILLGVILFIIYSTTHEKTRLKNEDYEGEILGKLKADKHNEMIVLQNNNEVKLTVPYIHKNGSNITLFNAIEPRDFIIKKKGEYKYSLIKGNDTIVFYVDTTH